MRLGRTTSTEFYNKVVSQLEAGEVRETFGRHLAHYVHSTNKHLYPMLRHRRAKKRMHANRGPALRLRVRGSFQNCDRRAGGGGFGAGKHQRGRLLRLKEMLEAKTRLDWGTRMEKIAEKDRNTAERDRAAGSRHEGNPWALGRKGCNQNRCPKSPSGRRTQKNEELAGKFLLVLECRDTQTGRKRVVAEGQKKTKRFVFGRKVAWKES